ncbi:MAG: hypothetical protein ABI977_32550 [Acidobacteriota bacterium]
MTITQQDVEQLLLGKTVKVTHPNSPAHNVCNREDECTGVIKTEGGHLDIAFGGDRSGFTPDVITDEFVEGEINALIPGRRRFTVIK